VEYGAGVSLPEGVLLAPWAQGAAWVDAELGAPRLQVLPLACP
jgi:hypothetical protein